MICYTNKLKKENHTVKAINAEKAFDKIQPSFMIKTLPPKKLEIKLNFLNLIKNIYKKIYS